MAKASNLKRGAPAKDMTRPSRTTSRPSTIWAASGKPVIGARLAKQWDLGAGGDEAIHRMAGAAT